MKRSLLFKASTILLLSIVMLIIEFLPYTSFQWVIIQTDDLYASVTTPKITLGTHHAGKGAHVLVQGHSFGNNENVSVWYEGVQSGSVVTDSSGHFETYIVIPPGNTGQRLIQAIGEETNTAVSTHFSQAF